MTTPSYESDALGRYYELLDMASELVEQGDAATARRVFAEADAARPPAIVCAFSGRTIDDGDGWSVEDEERWQETEARLG